VIKAILADDAAIMRKAISRLLKDCVDLELVAEADSYSGLMTLVSEHHPNVVILDLHMPDEDKVSMSELKSCLNGCSLLAMSVWNDAETKARADSFGAVCLLEKRLLAEQLIPAILHMAKRCLEREA